MNHTVCKGSIVMAANIVRTVINLSAYRKMLEEKHSRLDKISNLNRNCEENSHQFVRRKKIADRSYFAADIKKLRYLLDEAYQQMQQGQFRYAIYDAGSVMREAVKMILQYKNGYVSDDLLMNIKTCERRKLFGDDREFVSKLYEVYHICNNDNQRLSKEKYLNYKKVYLAIMQLKDLLNFVEREVIYSRE